LLEETWFMQGTLHPILQSFRWYTSRMHYLTGGRSQRIGNTNVTNLPWKREMRWGYWYQHRIWMFGIFIPVDSCEAASYSNHLPLWRIQAVEALPGVDEIKTLDKEFFFLEPVQCVPHGPWGQGGLADEFLLRQLAAVFKHFVHELSRWRQVPDSSGVVIPVCVYNKNDPS